MRPAVDFPTAEIDDILKLFAENGCVLLRRFCEPPVLDDIAVQVQTIFKEIAPEHYIWPEHLRERGLTMPHHLCSGKREILLSAVFGDFPWVEMDGLVARHINPADPSDGSAPPLNPHLDA